ncbi:hypothetical protein LSAT2_010368 [Lamellibrachia satsuma]|nr:hypothetical protein LSAT2_010368 [Lamellibrachia satsuma]
MLIAFYWGNGPTDEHPDPIDGHCFTGPKKFARKGKRPTPQSPSNTSLKRRKLIQVDPECVGVHADLKYETRSMSVKRACDWSVTAPFVSVTHARFTDIDGASWGVMFGWNPASTVTVSQPYANRWRNVGPTAATIVDATLLCSLGQRCAYVNSQPSTNIAPTINQPLGQRCVYVNSQPSANVAPTINQRCPNHQPTLPQPSTNVAPTISQRCSNHPPTLPQPSANVAPTISQCCPNHPPTLPQPSTNVTPTIC